MTTAAAATVVTSPVESPFPLEQGMSWSYEGKVQWTAINSTKVLSTNIHWVTDVVYATQNGPVRAAVVRGLPDELVWYEPDRTAGFTVLLSVPNHIYRIPVDSYKKGKTLVRRFIKPPHNLPSGAEEWLAFPFKKGKKWGGDSDREDNNYCWHVEGNEMKTLRVDGYVAAKPMQVWTVAYRTMPDHQIVQFVAGLGVTRYEFVHHGTVASVDLRLVSFRR